MARRIVIDTSILWKRVNKSKKIKGCSRIIKWLTKLALMITIIIKYSKHQVDHIFPMILLIRATSQWLLNQLLRIVAKIPATVKSQNVLSFTAIVLLLVESVGLSVIASNAQIQRTMKKESRPLKPYSIEIQMPLNLKFNKKKAFIQKDVIVRSLIV